MAARQTRSAPDSSGYSAFGKLGVLDEYDIVEVGDMYSERVDFVLTSGGTRVSLFSYLEVLLVVFEDDAIISSSGRGMSGGILAAGELGGAASSIVAVSSRLYGSAKMFLKPVWWITYLPERFVDGKSRIRLRSRETT